MKVSVGDAEPAFKLSDLKGNEVTLIALFFILTPQTAQEDVNAITGFRGT